MAELEDRHWWFVARRGLIAQSLSQSLELPEVARILEAGCGTGGNLQLLSRFGEVSGFEPDGEARNTALRKGNFDVREGHLPGKIPFDEESFDLVVALDVLEHLDDDRASLAALQKQLKTDGHLVVTVPAYQFLWSNHDVVHHHKRRYRMAPLKDLLETSGFELLRVSYFNTLLFPAVFTVRIAKKFIGDRSSDDALPREWLNSALRWILESEKHLLPFLTLPFGLSLLAIARKRV